MHPGGRILLFTGDGKGKTTAALGLSMRAAGHGMRVCFIQFIKSGDVPTGEAAFLERCGAIDLVRTGLGRVPPGGNPDFARHCAAADRGMERAMEAVRSASHHVVVLDEICVAIDKGLIGAGRVCELAGRVSGEQVMVMTGRNAPPQLIAASDTVTEMRCVKHAFNGGRGPGKGVEL